MKNGRMNIIDDSDIIEIGSNALIPNSAINIGNGTNVLLDIEALIPIIIDSSKLFFIKYLSAINISRNINIMLKKYPEINLIFSMTPIGSLSTAIKINAGIDKLKVISNKTFSALKDRALNLVKMNPIKIRLSIGKKA